ncbi:MAG: RNA methyltransferase [Desulfovibrionaceae bacterium]|nr:RNA methyltransferase [Desulfovibrionaceae bacterium]
MERRSRADKAADMSWVSGRKPVRELLGSSPASIDLVLVAKGRRDTALEDIIRACRGRGVRFRLADKAALDRACQGNHQGVAARCAALEYVDLKELIDLTPSAPLPLLVALDQVQDPGNVGVLARTIYALGGAGLIVCAHGGAFLGPAAVRSSAGALTRLPVARVTNLGRAVTDCARAGLFTYCAQDRPGAVNVLKAGPAMPALLVLGNEEKGLRPGVAKHCAESLFIPLARDFDSLNVAQAGAIMVAEFSRRTAS